MKLAHSIKFRDNVFEDFSTYVVYIVDTLFQGLPGLPILIFYCWKMQALVKLSFHSGQEEAGEEVDQEEEVVVVLVLQTTRLLSLVEGLSELTCQ